MDVANHRLLHGEVPVPARRSRRVFNKHHKDELGDQICGGSGEHFLGRRAR